MVLIRAGTSAAGMVAVQVGGGNSRSEFKLLNEQLFNPSPRLQQDKPIRGNPHIAPCSSKFLTANTIHQLKIAGSVQADFCNTCI